MLEIKVFIKSVYGIDKVYPADLNAKIFAKLANTTTLTPQTIELIKQLGYTVKVTIEKIGEL